jgi:hypothetical protein
MQPTTEPATGWLGDHRRRRRVAALGAVWAFLGCVATGGAYATVVRTYDVAPGTPFLVDMDPTYWTNYSSTCDGSGGGCLPANQPPSNPDTLLFSWGVTGDSDNSLLEMSYAGASFKLGEIKFRTNPNGEALGPNPPLFGYNPPQGFGTMVAYERNAFSVLDPSTGVHYVTDQRMDITVLDGGGDPLPGMQKTDLVVATGFAGDVMDSTTDFFVGGNPLEPDTGGFAQWSFDRSFDLSDLNLTVESGYKFQFRFYEAANRYNNVVSAVGDPDGPDAYYGDFFLTISPATSPELQVTDIDFDNVRAGTSATPLDMTASNVNPTSGDLTDVTFLDTASAPGLTGAPSAPTAPVNLVGSDTAVRTFSYTAPDLGKNDTQGQDLAATQAVTSGPGSQSEDGAISGTSVGPVLGVALDDASPNVGNPAEWFDYGSTIDLGGVAVDGDSFVKELVLANLFDTDLLNDTDLTFYNVGISDDPGGFFSIVSGTAPSVEAKLSAQDELTTLLQIAFDRQGSALKVWTATLSFLTDQNRTFGACDGVANLTLNCLDNGAGSLLTFTLRVTASEVPVPGVLALVAIGLISFGVTRRRLVCSD